MTSYDKHESTGTVVDYRNFINGEFVDSGPDMIEVFNPASGALLGRVPDSDKATVDDAVAAARAALPAWEKRPAVERGAVLCQMATKIREHEAELTDIIVREQGKIRPLANVEVNFTADYLDYMAGWARRIEGEVISSDRANETMFLLRKPIGVVAGILPWNFPFFLIARKLAPALVTGNTIVVKPSDDTPINAFMFAELAAQTDLPKGVFNLVGGPGRRAGEALVANPDVGMVSFTGSVGTGSHIMQEAGKNLTRVNLELGGKAPAIVLADADLDLAAKAIHQSRVINTGQVCNCAELAYVAEPVYDQMLEKLKALFEATRYGDPSVEENLDMGPLINQGGLDKVAAAVETAKAQGAEVVAGGHIAQLPKGFHYEPTLLADASPDMDIMCEETFGPVLPVAKVKDLDEAIALANASEYGLTSSLYTSNLTKAMQACRELKYGETYINRENFEAMQGFHAGRRKSGIGGADGKHGLYEYTETHVVYIQG